MTRPKTPDILGPGAQDPTKASTGADVGASAVAGISVVVRVGGGPGPGEGQLPAPMDSP